MPRGRHAGGTYVRGRANLLWRRSQGAFQRTEQRKGDVETVMRKVPGLVSYTLVQSAEGGIAVTVCQERRGQTRAPGLPRSGSRSSV
jgi:hypothetical protein